MLLIDFNYHTSNVGAVRRYLDRSSMVIVLHSLVQLRLDFCKTYKHLRDFLRKLHSVINSAAGVVYSLPEPQ